MSQTRRCGLEKPARESERASAPRPGAQTRPAPTPTDAPATRADFSAGALDSIRQSESDARRLATEAQASARVTAVIELLAQPVKAPTVAAEPTEAAETAPKKTESGPAGYNDTIKTLRGQDDGSGKLLDRAA